MLAFADDAAIARLFIAAGRVSQRKRSRWLRELAEKLDPPAIRSAAAVRQARVRARRRNGQHVYKLELADRAVEGLVEMMVTTGQLSEREALDHRRVEAELARLLEAQGARWSR